MSHSHQTHMNVPTFDVFITNSTDGVCATAKNAIVWFFTISLKHLFIIFSLSLSLYNVLFLIWVWFFVVWPPLHDCRVSQLSNRTNERTNTYERCRYFWHTLLEILMLFVVIVFSSLWNTPNAKQSAICSFCRLLCSFFVVVVFHSTLKSFSHFAQKYTHTPCLAVIAMNCALLYSICCCRFAPSSFTPLFFNAEHRKRVKQHT